MNLRPVELSGGFTAEKVSGYEPYEVRPYKKQSSELFLGRPGCATQKNLLKANALHDQTILRRRMSNRDALKYLMSYENAQKKPRDDARLIFIVWLRE